jgi:hypothetical protein
MHGKQNIDARRLSWGNMGVTPFPSRPTVVTAGVTAPRRRRTDLAVPDANHESRHNPNGVENLALVEKDHGEPDGNARRHSAANRHINAAPRLYRKIGL